MTFLHALTIFERAESAPWIAFHGFQRTLATYPARSPKRLETLPIEHVVRTKALCPKKNCLQIRF